MLNTHTHPHLCCSLHFQQQIDGALFLSQSLSPNSFSAHSTNFLVTTIKCRFVLPTTLGCERGKEINEEFPSHEFPHFIVLQTRNIVTAGSCCGECKELRNIKRRLKFEV